MSRLLGYPLHRLDLDDQPGDLHARLEGDAGPKAAPVDAAAFDRCAGEYEIQPGFVLKFWREGTKLYTQATGQPQAELFAENATTYFLKVVEAKVEFTPEPDGTVVRATLHQGGRKMPLKRVK